MPQPTRGGDPCTKTMFTILEPHLAISGPSQKIGQTFHSCPAQKDVPSTAKYTFIIHIVNLGLETITLYNIMYFELIVSHAYGNNQCIMDEGVTQ